MEPMFPVIKALIAKSSDLNENNQIVQKERILPFIKIIFH
jgi:hypothetical protein